MSANVTRMSKTQLEREHDRLDYGVHSAYYASLHYSARIDYCQARIKEIDSEISKLAREREELRAEMMDAPRRAEEARARASTYTKKLKLVDAAPLIKKLNKVKEQMKRLGLDSDVKE